MANEKISQLTNGAPAQSTDILPIARAGANFKLALSAIATLFSSSFDAAGAAAAAQAAAEAYTDTQLSGAAGTVNAGSLILPNGKTYKGNGSNVGTTVDAAVPISVVLDGGGAALASGVKVYYMCEFDGTISEVDCLADQSGSVALDIWKCTYAQFDAGSTHPVSADKITASAPPSITTATKYTDSTLTGWTVNFSKGDILTFVTTGAATNIQRVTMALRTFRR